MSPCTSFGVEAILKIAARGNSKAAASRADLGVEIAGVATAVPQNKVSQADIAAHARRLFPHLARREALFANTGIETRYTVKPLDWYHAHRGWRERMDAFVENALPLLEEAALAAIAEAGIAMRDVGALIVNTTTGMAVPSLDAKLMQRLDLPCTVERLPMFGLGCGGGVAGLARAARYARAMPERHVLFLTVELCSLSFRTADPSTTMFVATALFGDGAAGIVLRNTEISGGSGRGRVLAVGDHLWRQTEHIMGWSIEDDGFGIILSPELPSLLRTELAPAVDAFLDRNGMTLGEMTGFLFHPGGSRVLSTMEEALKLSREDLAISWDVLRRYGNMSSPTALFVLQEARQNGARGPHLLAALGPGFAATFAVVDL